MKLYNCDPTPNPLKVRLALAEMEALAPGKVHCEIHNVDVYKGETLKPEHTKLNPMAAVPVLEDGELVISQSSSILHHIAMKHELLLPKSQNDKSLMLHWMFFEASELKAPLFIWFNNFIRPKVGMPLASEEALAGKIKEASARLKILDSHLSKNEFMVGSDYSIADCVFTVALCMLSDTLLSSEACASGQAPWKNVIRYRNQMAARSSWKEAKGNLIIDCDL